MGDNLTGIEFAFIPRKNYFDYFSDLPEDIKEAINEHEDEFHSVEELHRFIERQKLKS